MLGFFWNKEDIVVSMRVDGQFITCFIDLSLGKVIFIIKKWVWKVTLPIIIQHPPASLGDTS